MDILFLWWELNGCTGAACSFFTTIFLSLLVLSFFGCTFCHLFMGMNNPMRPSLTIMVNGMFSSTHSLLNNSFFAIFTPLLWSLCSIPNYSKRICFICFSESLCTLVDDSTSSRVCGHLAALDFLALLFCQEAKSLVKNPDRVLHVASVSELLDFPLGEGQAWCVLCLCVCFSVQTYQRSLKVIDHPWF